MFLTCGLPNAKNFKRLSFIKKEGFITLITPCLDLFIDAFKKFIDEKV